MAISNFVLVQPINTGGTLVSVYHGGNNIQYIIDENDDIMLVHVPVDSRWWCLEGDLLFVPDSECPDDVWAREVG